MPLCYASSVQPTPLKLTAANNSVIRSYGCCELVIVFRKLRREFRWNCIIADVSTPLIGADFLHNFNLSVNMKNQQLIDDTTHFSVCGVKCTSDTVMHSVFAVQNDTPSFVIQLLQKHKAITEPIDCTLPVLHNTKHHIETSGPPIYSKPRPLHGDKLEAVKKEFSELPRLGIVRHSNSPWASPIHLVPKGDGWRICGDYRRLNNVTQKDRYPMPNTSALIGLLHGSKVFSKLDLVRGYNQIPMEESSIPKTAVTTPVGLFEYLRMPFGLCNAAQTFQRFMNELLGSLPFVFIYIDDVLIFSASETEHQEHMDIVFGILAKNGLRISPEKCSFCQDEISFLGYELSQTGIRPGRNKCAAIREMTLPADGKELHSYLGTIGFFRQFIPNFADISHPLYERLRTTTKTQKLELTDKEVQSFVHLQQCLEEAVEHSYVDPNSHCFTITSDASKKAIGAVLHQRVNGSSRIIRLYSRKLKDAELRYSVFDLELLAAHDAVKFFKPLIDGANVTLFTDHKALSMAFTKKGEIKSDRQSRQLSFLSEYVSAIEYIKGEENVIADYFSRVGTVNNVQVDLYDLEAVAKHQSEDEECKLVQRNSSSTKIYNMQGYELWCETSTGKPRPIVPACLRQVIFNSIHSLGHAGKKQQLD